MSVQIMFEGETISDVVAQAQTFVAAFGAAPAAVAPTETPAPKATRKKAASAEPKTETETKPDEQKSEPEQPKAPPAAAEPDKALVKAKEDALAVARDLFASGPAGQDQVRRVAKDFEVTKLGNVPVEKGVELLNAVNEAKSAANVAKAVADAESVV
jgi:hypothetical protein